VLVAEQPGVWHERGSAEEAVQAPGTDFCPRAAPGPLVESGGGVGAAAQPVRLKRWVV